MKPHEALNLPDLDGWAALGLLAAVEQQAGGDVARMADGGALIFPVVAL